MIENKVICSFYYGDSIQNRKETFNKALSCTKRGKVLYILSEELNELPQLSQDLNQIDRHYIKMISFLYASNLQSLIESIVTLPTWQNIPSTIILDNLSFYCPKDNFQMACATTSLLIDTANSCSKLIKSTCRLYLAVPCNTFNRENFETLQELYITNTEENKVL